MYLVYENRSTFLASLLNIFKKVCGVVTSMLILKSLFFYIFPNYYPSKADIHLKVTVYLGDNYVSLSVNFLVRFNSSFTI